MTGNVGSSIANTTQDTDAISKANDSTKTSVKDATGKKKDAEQNELELYNNL